MTVSPMAIPARPCQLRRHRDHLSVLVGKLTPAPKAVGETVILPTRPSSASILKTLLEGGGGCSRMTVWPDGSLRPEMVASCPMKRHSDTIGPWWLNEAASEHLPAGPGGSARCYWNGCGDSATTRLNGLPARTSRAGQHAADGMAAETVQPPGFSDLHRASLRRAEADRDVHRAPEIRVVWPGLCARL